MYRWALQGCSVSNKDLWDSLRSLLSCTSETLWKHIYGHVGVVGNERADTLANLGRLQLRDLQHRRRLNFVVLPSWAGGGFVGAYQCPPPHVCYVLICGLYVCLLRRFRI